MKRYLLAISSVGTLGGFNDIERHSDRLELVKKMAEFHHKQVSTQSAARRYEILDTETGAIHRYNHFENTWSVNKAWRSIKESEIISEKDFITDKYFYIKGIDL